MTPGFKKKVSTKVVQKKIGEEGMNRLKTSWLLCSLAFSFFADTSRAQDFPSRRIQITVPYAAGGVTDQITRIVSESASNILGQPIIVENRGGGGGQMAASAVKNAEPDGYTLMLADIGTHAINQSIYRTLSYEPFNDFQAIAIIGESPQVLVVPVSSPLKSIADIVDAARKSPDSIYYASPGVGSGSHLLGEMLRSSKNIAITHVPYKGSSAIMPDLLAGRISIYFGAATSAYPFIKDGTMRAIATTDLQRIPQLPDVPTTAELGAPDLVLTLWVGLLAPAKTPKNIIAKLHDAYAQALQTPKVRELFASIILNVPKPHSSGDYLAFMKAETNRLAPIVKAAGVVVD